MNIGLKKTRAVYIPAGYVLASTYCQPADRDGVAIYTAHGLDIKMIDIYWLTEVSGSEASVILMNKHLVFIFVSSTPYFNIYEFSIYLRIFLL